MKKPIYPMIAVALASTLVAPPLSAFAQRAPDQQHQQPKLSGTKRGPTVTPPQRVHNLNLPPGRGRGPQGARLPQTPLRSHNFGGHVYHGQLDWRHGRWHHETRNGRYGWWWDVGGAWYFYPEPIEGPPDYVSNIEVMDDATAAPPPPPPKEPLRAFYYRPGDFKGVPYESIQVCTEARQRDGNVGTCVIK